MVKDKEEVEDFSSNAVDEYDDQNDGEEDQDELSVPVTLVCRKSDSKVMFAEAGKDFVDLLMSFMLLPVATVMHLIRNSGEWPGAFGAMGVLSDSIRKMQSSAFYEGKQSMLMSPDVAIDDLQADLLGLERSGSSSEDYYYKCAWCARIVPSKYAGQMCSTCQKPMAVKLELQRPNVKLKGGYVKSILTFTITDNLEIFPSSTLKSIELLNKLRVRSTDLENVEVLVGPNEAFSLLKAFMASNTVLNDAFRSSAASVLGKRKRYISY